MSESDSQSKKTILNTLVDHYNSSIAIRQKAIQALSEAFRVFHCPKDGSKPIAEFPKLQQVAMESALQEAVRDLAVERSKVVCPECDAPLAVYYEGSSLGDSQLFEIKECSKGCDFSHKKEIKRNGN